MQNCDDQSYLDIIIRALHWYHRDHGFESHLGLNFFLVLISQLVKLNAELWWSIISWSSYHSTQFKYMNLRIFTGILHLHKWPAPSWLDSPVGPVLHRYCRRHEVEPCSGLNFWGFQYFHNCLLSCVPNCNSQAYLHILIIVVFSLLFFKGARKFSFLSPLEMENFIQMGLIKHFSRHVPQRNS